MHKQFLYICFKQGQKYITFSSLYAANPEKNLVRISGYLVSSDLAGKFYTEKWALLCPTKVEEVCITVFLLCVFGELEQKHRENENSFLSPILLVNNVQSIIELFDLNLFQNVEGFSECTFTILIIHTALV